MRRGVLDFKCVHLHCIQHSRFTKQDGWRLWDLSLSLSGNIAVTGYNENTHQTSIAVYSPVRNSGSKDKPKISYSKEFDKYESEGATYWFRFVSFVDSYDDNRGLVVVTGLGDKLEVFDLNQDRVLKSRKVTLVNPGGISCLSVREREIFIGLGKSNKITVYDVTDLNEIKSIILQGIQDGYWPYYMTAITDKIFACTTNAEEESYERSLIFDEKNGKILSELTKPTDTRWYTSSVTLCVPLGVVAVVWSQTYIGTRKGFDVIAFYSLFSPSNTSFLIAEIEFGVFRIRISDRGDRMVTMNEWKGEVKLYDMAEFCTYNHFKENLILQLQPSDLLRLKDYFALPEDQWDIILKSETPAENLLLALEVRGSMELSSVDRLTEAFDKLNISPSCNHLVDFYRRTRIQTTSYDTFLASLSAHLTASLPADLCDYFNISDEDKSSITSSQNPGLSLLLALDGMDLITPSDIGTLEQPFTDLKLVQALAKVHEFQSLFKEESQSQTEAAMTNERKREFFIQCLQRKIKSWYEIMTPVPWKKSCKWKSTELFVGSGLVLTNSKTKKNLTDIDEQCKLQYTEVFTHDRLRLETRVILEGDPGSGKTMLASQLAYDWSQGKISEIGILILLPLKLVGSSTIVESVKEFYIPASNDLSAADIDSVIQDESSKCCFILDGLEEYNGEGDTTEVMKVMTKSKYPSCKVILTSRSDFSQALPPCPTLKIGRFGDKERNSYIQKVFSGDLRKQHEVANVVEENPFVLDLCSVPVLFVLAVHNIESMDKIERRHVDRLAPFMDSMVETLCPSYTSQTEADDLVSGNAKQGEVSLGKVSYNGLCRGLQQLSWHKEFIERSVAKSKQWLDSGILVVDDSKLSMTNVKDQPQRVPTGAKSSVQTTDLNESARAQETTATKKPDTFQRILPSIGKPSTLRRQSTQTATLSTPLPDTHKSLADSDVRSSDAIQSQSQVIIGKAEAAGSAANHVSLQVKFLHKTIQEWFAAIYYAHTISQLKTLEDQQRYLRESLALINPADLHYVLRFTCALYPPCAHIIIKHLFTNYRLKDGRLPEYIVDCAFLCFAEIGVKLKPYVLEVVKMICKESIIIRSEDSRLLQQAKVAMMKLASSAKIIIRKLSLADIVISANNDVLTFNSGVTMKIIDTLRVIEISRWDQTLKDEDYKRIVKFISKFRLLAEAKLHFPSQPPDLDKETLIQVAINNKRVTWSIGPRISQTLDVATGLWQFQSIIAPLAGIREHQDPQNVGLEAETVVSREGGKLEIPNTGVQLNIPPDAFEDDVDQCLMKMRIILPGIYNTTATSFTSNTSTVVELLPNNLRLKQTAILTIPHCLELGVDRGDGSYTAKVFITHHEKGHEPFWEEQPNLLYYLGGRKCLIWLDSFCWVKYEVNGAVVEGKKLQVYAAGEPHVPGDDVVETEVGYYPDLPGGGEILRNNKSLILSQQKPFIFLKNQQLPLTLSLLAIKPSSWIPFEQSQEIPFQSIAADYEEHSCPFIFENESQAPSPPVLIFRVSQGDRDVKLRLRPQAAEKMVHYQREEEHMSSEKPLRDCFLFLKRNLVRDWKDLGRYLMLSEAELSRVSCDNKDDVGESMYQMLIKWQQENGPRATRTKLLEALEKLGRKDLIQNLPQ